MESEYSKYFDSIANECDISELSEHTLGALFWDKQQEKIDKLEEMSHIKELIKARKLLRKFCTKSNGVSIFARSDWRSADKAKEDIMNLYDFQLEVEDYLNED